MNSNIDLIYFWSSLVLVALPLITFSVLTYLVIKGYFRKMREKRDGRSPSPSSPDR